jgi:predicted nucleic acid-binding protein
MSIFDTNILIDYLQGNIKAAREISSDANPSVSIVTWMEVLAGAETQSETKAAYSALSAFAVIHIDMKIAALAVENRKTLNLKLPDAIIYATALSLGTVVITCDKSFPKTRFIRKPY